VLNQYAVLDTRALLRSAVWAATVVLLLSMGGAIFGSPFLLPLLGWTGRSSPSPRVGVVAAVLAGLVAAEVGWAATYVTVGEEGPWIVAIPVVTGALVVVAFLRCRPRPAAEP